MHIHQSSRTIGVSPPFSPVCVSPVSVSPVSISPICVSQDDGTSLMDLPWSVFQASVDSLCGRMAASHKKLKRRRRSLAMEEFEPWFMSQDCSADFTATGSALASGHFNFSNAWKTLLDASMLSEALCMSGCWLLATVAEESEYADLERERASLALATAVWRTRFRGYKKRRVCLLLPEERQCLRLHLEGHSHCTSHTNNTHTHTHTQSHEQKASVWRS
eukprot:GHVR01143359.1.p1 GENE.GHVR01143359.1~~GHVR01143359.1.p1  ORF type:complete len:219 (-),score=77.75 GHVR01143359.1:159-815(-)